ncbi:FMN-binding domain protein [Alicyclobacillus acidocaldarius subsp. acidocaldarius DSM 446]|uniref:FMN-binding domain protein n=2 Tax=Alicyclobacillus acidocaldarius TaxID=405212 RepID=C8WT92_ALIAD|nr:FMN-binding domain protein [Alicyclobacillus acidocaldarius subsp. acidocaldarius DSM 446]
MIGASPGWLHSSFCENGYTADRGLTKEAMSVGKLGRAPLVAICTAAIAAMYGAGYVITEPYADRTLPGSAPTSPRGHAGEARGEAPSERYLDGVYRGSGSDQIGTIDVEVTIAGGRIAKVVITRCDTHYPQSDIDPVLPDEVVKAQSADVRFVSGATLSSFAFALAVQQALHQAKNPAYAG